MKVTLKLPGKRKTKYEKILLQFTDNGIVLSGYQTSMENMFVPYGSFEYIIYSFDITKDGHTYEM